MRKRIRETIKEALPVIGFILAGTALALLALGILTPAAMADNDELVAKQAKAHEIAELARELGLSEDDAIIKRASALWWEWENQKTEEPERTYLGVYKVTGYDPACAHCCGKSDGITASGVKAAPGVTAAMKGVPFGTKLYIERLGTYTVQDRGVGNGVIDVACDGHRACYAVTGRYEVWEVAECET